MQYRRRLRGVMLALMLVLLLTSITVSAFHNHRDCENPNNCAICTFHVSSSALALDTAQGSDPYDEPILLSAITLPERVSEPFHISVFPSHAPPQFI
ncbi:MAG: hypothetical protein ABR936_09455 [Bacteroidota bacterium]|jgi:cytochrome c556